MGYKGVLVSQVLMAQQEPLEARVKQAHKGLKALKALKVLKD
jgi:hypothetical protein